MFGALRSTRFRATSTSERGRAWHMSTASALPATRRLRTCTSPVTKVPSQVWQTPLRQE